jgi:hypothetical protein
MQKIFDYKTVYKYMTIAIYKMAQSAETLYRQGKKKL